jgi:hypothetical protein
LLTIIFECRISGKWKYACHHYGTAEEYQREQMHPRFREIEFYFPGQQMDVFIDDFWHDQYSLGPTKWLSRRGNQPLQKTDRAYHGRIEPGVMVLLQ